MGIVTERVHVRQVLQHAQRGRPLRARIRVAVGRDARFFGGLRGDQARGHQPVQQADQPVEPGGRDR